MYEKKYVYIMARDLDNGKAVGYGALNICDIKQKVAVLEEAYVTPDYRRRGVYGMLIEEREKIACTTGFTRIRVFPGIDGLSSSVLAKYGYEDRYNDYEGDYMVKKLSKSELHTEGTYPHHESG
jgi:GNAT superfamily N-acetyltransferase